MQRSSALIGVHRRPILLRIAGDGLWRQARGIPKTDEHQSCERKRVGNTSNSRCAFGGDLAGVGHASRGVGMRHA